MKARHLAPWALLAPLLAQAHTDVATGGGFVRGFLHPFTGGDHLLAMVAVGMWGAILGAPLVWLLPVAFPMLMVIGAVTGVSHSGEVDPLIYLDGGYARAARFA